MNIQELLKTGSNVTLAINIEDLRIILNEAIEKATAKQELPRYQTPIQLSELLGLKLTTVYQNHHNGLIPGAKKVGGRLLFDTKLILAWIDEKSIPTREEKIRALSMRGAK